MVTVVPLEPFSVSAACDHVSSLSVEDFFVRSRLVSRARLRACFQVLADPLRRLPEALWLSSLSPPFCVIALIGHVHSLVEIFSFSKGFLLVGTDVPSFSRLD